ncbi:MAG: GntR family transcriptional regulator [Pirellulaceae bacterium]|nr:GntR family transcriptional regulator [Pirellulaceae bacterium]
MKFNIDVDNGVPIFEQLIRQIKFAIAEGVLVPGEMIPSTRELAKQLAINPNTVQRAFTELQGEQVLEVLRGRGLAVTAGAKKRCVSARQQLIVEQLERVIAEGLRSGLEPDNLRNLFERQLNKSARQQGE